MRSRWILVGCLLASESALAAPVATAKLDVDGDGTPDPVDLGSDGTLAIGGKPSGSVKVATAVTAGRVSLAMAKARDDRRHPVLVVEVTAPPKSEAILVGLQRGAWAELARFPIGGQGLDADYSIAVDARPDGVIRYQQRPGIRRCDGKSAYLFPEVFLIDTKKFGRGVPPADLDEKLPTLAAKADPSSTAPPLLYQARAASHQPGQTDAGGLGLPRELDDGRIDTAWREELGSDGRGQFFTFEPRAAGVKAHQLRIVNGNHTSAQRLKAERRVRSIGIATASGSWRVELPDPASTPVGTAHVVELPQPISGCVSVVIESTYGSDNSPTSISSLEIFAEGERAGGGDAMLARMLVEGKVDTTNVAAALGRRGPAGVLAIETELAKTSDAGARRRLVGALVKIKDPSAMATLAKAARSGWVQDRDLLDVIRALAAGGQVQALRDLAKEDLAIEYRLEAVKGISATATGGFDALSELAGTGPKAVRHLVIEQLASAPAASLIAAAGGATDPPLAGDLWRALTRRMRTDASARESGVAAMLAALPAATDYERRYRLVDGIATHGDAAALKTLDAMLRSLPPGAHSSALRQVAVHGLATAPRPEGVSIVIALAKDPDPGVRLATLAALAMADTSAGGAWHAAGGVDAIDRVIINSLAADERWPEVRDRAATALATRCQRPGPAAALLATVDRDRSIDVRKTALSSLVQCKGANVAELLPIIWDNGKAPLKMRTHAVTLAPALGDPKLCKSLVPRFTRWRGEAIASVAGLELAKTAAGSIGRLCGAAAAPALLDALGDSAFPEIVSAAALGLGALGKACPADAKAALEALARSDEQSARAAKIGASMCGR